MHQFAGGREIPPGKRRDEPGGLAGSGLIGNTATVDGRGREPGRGASDDGMERRQAGHRLDPFTAAGCNSRAAGEEPGDIAADTRADFREAGRRPVEPPHDRRRAEHGGGITRATAEAGARGDFLGQLDVEAALDPRHLGKAARRADDEIRIIRRHIAAEHRTGRLGEPATEADAQAHPGGVDSPDDQPVGERHRHHERFDLVKAVGSTGEDRQGEIELGRGGDRDGVGIVGKHGHARREDARRCGGRRHGTRSPTGYAPALNTLSLTCRKATHPPPGGSTS